MKHYDDYKQYSDKTRVRHHEPLYLLREIADMFHIDLHQLQQKMSVAARKRLPHPHLLWSLHQWLPPLWSLHPWLPLHKCLLPLHS